MCTGLRNTLNMQTVQSTCTYVAGKVAVFCPALWARRKLADLGNWAGTEWCLVWPGLAACFCVLLAGQGLGGGGDMTTLDKSVKEKWLGQAQLLAFTESGKMCFVPQESRKCFIHSFFSALWPKCWRAKKVLTTGIEPVTTALLAPCSTDWAKRADNFWCLNVWVVQVFTLSLPKEVHVLF